MKFVVFDTETTGLWKFNRPLTHPIQPYTIQTSAMLYDHAGKCLVDKVVYTKPLGGRAISPDAEKVHGISNEYIAKHGMDMAVGMREIREITRQADLLVGFNIDFDIKILEASSLRSDPEEFKKNPIFSPKQKKFCVMRNLHRELKMKKFPKLTEAVELLLKEDHTQAHDARGDVLATARLFAYMAQNGMLHLD